MYFSQVIINTPDGRRIIDDCVSVIPLREGVSVDDVAFLYREGLIMFQCFRVFDRVGVDPVVFTDLDDVSMVISTDSLIEFVVNVAEVVILSNGKVIVCGRDSDRLVAFVGPGRNIPSMIIIDYLSEDGEGADAVTLTDTDTNIVLAKISRRVTEALRVNKSRRLVLEITLRRSDDGGNEIGGVKVL